MLLETNDIAPGHFPKADHLQLDSPGGGSECQAGRSSRSKNLRQAHSSLRWQRSRLPLAERPWAACAGDAVGTPGRPEATPGKTRTVKRGFLALGHGHLRPRQPTQQLSPARWGGRPARAGVSGCLPPHRRAGPSRWPKTPSSSRGPGGAHRARAGRPQPGQDRSSKKGPACLLGVGGSPGERGRRGARRRGGHEGPGRPGAGRQTRAPRASGRAWPARGESGRRSADPGARGPGPAARTHPRSPPGARRSG